jgi:hypothetical protein
MKNLPEGFGFYLTYSIITIIAVPNIITVLVVIIFWLLGWALAKN